MPVNVSAVMWNGVPFECPLSERSRTTIYRVPQFFAVAGEGLSSVVFDAGNFRRVSRQALKNTSRRMILRASSISIHLMAPGCESVATQGQVRQPQIFMSCFR